MVYYRYSQGGDTTPTKGRTANSDSVLWWAWYAYIDCMCCRPGQLGGLALLERMPGKKSRESQKLCLTKADRMW